MLPRPWRRGGHGGDSPARVVSANSTGEWVEVQDARLYVEVHGKGQPLVLCHGGVSTGHSWAYWRDLSDESRAPVGSS